MGIEQYFSGQGKLEVAKRLVNGQPGPFRWLGDVAATTFSADQKSTDYTENYTGGRGLALTLQQSVSGKIACKILQVNQAQFNFLFRGLDTIQAAGAVVGHAVGSVSDVLTVGQIYTLDAVKLSAVTIKDSTGAPLTLVAGVNYQLNPEVGSIEILDVTTGGSFVMPLVADYTKAAATGTKMFSGVAEDYWVRFNGMNTAVSGYPKVLAEWYKARPTPLKAMDFINDTRAEFDVEFSVLVDSTKSASGPFGQFGRIYDLA